MWSRENLVAGLTIYQEVTALSKRESFFASLVMAELHVPLNISIALETVETAYFLVIKDK